MMKRRFGAGFTAAAALAAALSSSAAFAALAVVGPVNPATGFPTSYQDTSGVALGSCVDVSGFCLNTPPDPTKPLSVPNNFTAEDFYWNVTGTMPTSAGGQALLLMGTEATFFNGVPVAGEQMVFSRFRIRADNLVAGATYTLTYPFGVRTFVATKTGVRGINVTEDTGCVAPAVPGTPGTCDFTLAMLTPFTFLGWDPAIPPAAPPGYIGDPTIPHQISGSPLGTNIFRLEGPNVGGPGVNLIETNLFSVQGKRIAAAPAAAAVISVAPTALTFAAQQANTASAPLTVTVTNTGGAPLTVSGATIAGTGGAAFAISSNTCVAAVAPAGTCSLGITFTPSAAAPFAATLSLAHNAAGTPTVVTLAGTGTTPPPPAPNATFVPASLNFGNVAILAPAAGSLNVTNPGTAPLVVSSVTATPAQFTVTAETCTAAPVAPGGQCTVRLQFLPTAAGAVAGTLTVADNTAVGTHLAALAGTGAAARLTASPTNNCFGTRNVGSTTSKTVTVKNAGAAATITSITIAGANPADFSVSGDTCSGRTLAAGASCRFNANFLPTAAGNRSGSATISSGTTSLSVTLTGRGK